MIEQIVKFSAELQLYPFFGQENVLENSGILVVKAGLAEGADDQKHADMEALASALRQKGSSHLEQRTVATDHSLSDHRIALQAIVIDWLQKLQ